MATQNWPGAKPARQINASHREEKEDKKIGLIDLGVEGLAAFPGKELGFVVEWRSTPARLRRSMRLVPVTGIVIRSDLIGLHSTASVFRSAGRQDRGASVWLVMMSPREIMLAKVVEVLHRPDGRMPVDLMSLTPRELDVLTSIRQGHTNKAIALSLGISLSTVKRHVEHLLAKLGATNRAQAAALLRGHKS